MPPAGNLKIFWPTVPQQPVAALFLIENSREIVDVWPDLRDRYIQTLADALIDANPEVPINMSVLPSCPIGDQNANNLVPQPYNSLRDFRFNYHPGNKISAGKICRGIDYLVSTTCHGQPPARHLIIVAGSTPSEDTDGLELHDQYNSSIWTFLAQRLSQVNIHCHIVLQVHPSQDLNTLINFFNSTLRLQRNVEITPWFPYNPQKYMFLLSGRPIEPHIFSPDIPTPRMYGNPISNHSSLVLRSHSFSQEDPLTVTTAEDAAEPSASPSLVSQLQQVHGLTKKKVYGAKPPRQPFFREERIRESHHHPAPLIMPPPHTTMQYTSMTGPHGRTTSRSRAERLARVGQSNLTTSRSRQPTSRRGSRLSSPDFSIPISSPTSPSSYGDTSPVNDFSSKLPSPVSPTATEDSYLDQSTIGGISFQPLNSPIVMTSEPTWLQNQYLAPETPHDMSSTSPHISRMQQSNVSIPINGSPNLTSPPLSHLPEYTLNSFQISPSGISAQGRPSIGERISVAPTALRTIESQKDEGDVPFIFSEEYDAAMALRSKEISPVLGDYPVTMSRDLSFDLYTAPAPSTNYSRIPLPPPFSAPPSSDNPVYPINHTQSTMFYDYSSHYPQEHLPSEDNNVALTLKSFSLGYVNPIFRSGSESLFRG